MESDVIALGQRIIDQLSIDESDDILERWMAHYLAEQMLAAQSSTGEAKEAAKQLCSELIVKLWERKMLPRNDAVQSMMQTLERLRSHSYFIMENEIDDKQNDFSAFPQSVRDWMQLAESIDAAARIWISQALEEASEEATRLDFPGLSELLDTGGNTISVIVRSFGIDNDNDSLQQRVDHLEKRLSDLDNFVALSCKLRALYVDELAAMKKEA